MTNGDKRSRLAKNTLMQYALQAAKYLFPFATIPYLTRVLGPDVFAIRAYILSAMTFAQVFLEFGFTPYGTREIANANGCLRRISAIVTSVAYARLGLCLAGLGVLAVVANAVPIMASNLTYVLLAYITVSLKAMLPDFVFQGLQDMGIITYRYVVSQLMSTILIFVLVRAPEDLLWIPILEGGAALVAFAWSWMNVLAVRHIKVLRIAAGGYRTALQTATVFFLSSASTTIFSSFTTLMIGVWISDLAEVSYWSLAMTAVTAVQSLYLPITTSLYPYMCVSRDYGFVRRLLILCSGVVAVGSILFALMSEHIMRFLGGGAYLDGSYVIVLVSPVLLFSFVAMMTGLPILGAAGETRLLTLSSIVAALFHILGLFVLRWIGCFDLYLIALLRCATEFLLMMLRLVFARSYMRDVAIRSFPPDEHG